MADRQQPAELGLYLLHDSLLPGLLVPGCLWLLVASANRQGIQDAGICVAWPTLPRECVPFNYTMPRQHTMLCQHTLLRLWVPLPVGRASKMLASAWPGLRYLMSAFPLTALCYAATMLYYAMPLADFAIW